MSPLWLKIVCALFVCVLVPVNWYQYGPVNFLWFSDLAVFMLVPALWCDNRLLVSMASLAVLLPEIAWNLDFFIRLTTGKSGIGLSGYMFDRRIPLWIRAVSLFHVWLPPLLVWMLYRLGYDRRALLWQTVVAAIVVPLSYALGDAQANVNWVYGFGDQPQSRLPPRVFAFAMTRRPCSRSRNRPRWVAAARLCICNDAGLSRSSLSADASLAAKTLSRRPLISFRT